MTQNVFDKNKYARTISLNTHCLVLFKNTRDANQFDMLSRQMYPSLGDLPSKPTGTQPSVHSATSWWTYDRIEKKNGVGFKQTFFLGKINMYT